jgi:hypothetical protein
MDTTPENSPLTEAQDLIWALLDDQISTSDFKHLEAMLQEDEEARRLYVQCVQLHVDLQQWFASNPGTTSCLPAGAPLNLPLPDGDSQIADPAF